ncbi:MAG: ATP-grasp domain-containing protein [Chloroflexi bacterium]|nr:ATP-grasp domain-containing protein [Chloroflexota bacterium]
MFSKVLVANRGEIACRIIRTCRRMGIATVAAYSDADASALHVRIADEAYRVGQAPAEQSYLKMEAIVEAALKSGADAVHPGYGFLSQNAAFARLCHENGLVFIGPRPEVLEMMKDKVEARRLAQEAGLPLIPGTTTTVSDDEALAEADALGFPVMVKAAQGGGGIGITLVSGPQRLKGVLARARRLARAAFGNGELYLEQYVDGAAHVEVQVVGDDYGNILHLYERECSVQRRNQKVVEEAPSKKLSSRRRTALLEAAVALCRHIGYSGVGTVEFLLDRKGRFYFMEMNTRLQVEHGITELITGLDMVELQIRASAGEHLALTQKRVYVRGHAVEARVYAEDPETFLPSAGVVQDLAVPHGKSIRVDTALYKGCEITTYYDPLVAKVMAWSRTRRGSINRLGKALESFKIEGVKTNLETLKAVLVSRGFRSGTYDTQFLSKLIPRLKRRGQVLAGLEAPGVHERDVAAVVALALAMGTPSGGREGVSPWKTQGRYAQMTSRMQSWRRM